MLYLVRKVGESIIINGNIEVKVIELKGNSAKLGFDFPKTATVLRKEIHDRIVQENIAAATGLEDNDLKSAIVGNKLTLKKPAGKDEPDDDKGNRIETDDDRR